MLFQPHRNVGVVLAALCLTNAVAQAQPFVATTLPGDPHHSFESEYWCFDEPLCFAAWTGGAAVGDYDADGDPDVFVTSYGGVDELWENRDGSFHNVSNDVGLGQPSLSNGAAFVDVDNDGDLDLIVTRAVGGRHALYINDGLTHPDTGRPRFDDDAANRGFPFAADGDRPLAGFSIAAGDFDRDGWPDLFFTEWVGNVDFCGREQARLLRNVGASAPGHFQDWTSAAGVVQSSRSDPSSWSWAAAFRDLDDDGFQDLAVVGDFGRSRLFWNGGDMTFTEGGAAAGVATDASGMGSSFADVDRDGDLDWFVGAIMPNGTDMVDPEYDGNRLYRNDGGRSFTDITDAAGVRDSGWTWGTAFVDADHDGDLDLVAVNGFELLLSQKERARYFEQGEDHTFIERGQDVGITDDGEGRGLVTLDFDLDGDLDVLVVRNGDRPLLLRNDGGSARGDWLMVRTVGGAGTRDAFGAVVRVSPSTPGAQPMLETVDSSTDFLGQSERVAHFGLGEGCAAGGGTVDLEATFLSGHVVSMTGIEPNQSITVVEPGSAAPRPPATSSSRCVDPCAVDCDADGTGDACQIAARPTLDCDRNQVLDSCEIETGLAVDCDVNGVIDVCDIQAQPSLDADNDGVIDACSLEEDAGVTMDAGLHPADAAGTSDAASNGHDSSVAPSDAGWSPPRGGASCSVSGGDRYPGPWRLAWLLVAPVFFRARRRRSSE